jgi:putative transposase
LDDVEKEALRRLLWKMSEFCGVRLVTYCIMGNHFHALVEVPKREIWLERLPGRRARRGSLSTCACSTARNSSGCCARNWRNCGGWAWMRWLGEAGADPAAVLRSVAVCEGGEGALQSLVQQAAGAQRHAVDGPVQERAGGGQGRAAAHDGGLHRFEPGAGGLVEDPKDYRWSGYGEAMGGSQRARRGLAR